MYYGIHFVCFEDVSCQFAAVVGALHVFVGYDGNTGAVRGCLLSIIISLVYVLLRFSRVECDNI